MSILMISDLATGIVSTLWGWQCLNKCSLIAVKQEDLSIQFHYQTFKMADKNLLIMWLLPKWYHTCTLWLTTSMGMLWLFYKQWSWKFVHIFPLLRTEWMVSLAILSLLSIVSCYHHFDGTIWLWGSMGYWKLKPSVNNMSYSTM